MALCINQSGTWRSITTQCVNQSGTWRKITTGCINQSGTWRQYGFIPPLGGAYEGGYYIALNYGLRWIAAPFSTEQSSVTWNNRTQAITAAQSASGCTGWFIPTCFFFECVVGPCKQYWDAYSIGFHWTDTQVSYNIFYAYVMDAQCLYSANASFPLYARAFRCVSA